MSTMDGFKKGLRSLAKESSKNSFGNGASSTSTSTSLSDQYGLLVPRTQGRTVSIWTCSKLCGVAFVAGIIVGYTLKRRVRRWAERFLRRLKD